MQWENNPTSENLKILRHLRPHLAVLTTSNTKQLVSRILEQGLSSFKTIYLRKTFKAF